MDNFPDNNPNDNTIDTTNLSPATELTGPMQDTMGKRTSETPLKDAASELKTPDNAAELASKSRKRLMVIIGSAATAVTVGAVIIFKAATGSVAVDTEPPKSDPVAVAPIESAEPVPTSTAREPQVFTNEQLIALETMTPPAEIQAYIGMPVEEVEALDITERLKYASWLSRDNKYIDAKFYEGNGKDVRYLVPDEVSATSTPEDVLAAAESHIAYAFVSHFGGYVYDKDSYQKALSAGFLDTEENPNYNRWTQNLSENTHVFPPAVVAEQGGLQHSTEILSDSASELVTFEDGVERTVRTITHVTASNETLTSSYALVDFEDYQGKQRTTYVSVTE